MRESIASVSEDKSCVRRNPFSRLFASRLLILSMVAYRTAASPRCTDPPRSARLLLLHTPHPAIFCAGADLRERRTMSSGQVAAFLDSLRSLLMEMEELRVPTIAVVDGFAMGGGCELALGCDLRVGGG